MSRTWNGCEPGLTIPADRWLSIAKWTRSCAANGSAKSSLPAVGINECAGIKIMTVQDVQTVPIVQTV